MTWNWKHYAMACVVVSAALLKYGAPLFAVILGAAAFGVVGFLKFRRAA